MQLDFSIEGVPQLSRRLTRFNVAIDNFKSTFKDTGEYLTKFFSGEVFETEGRVFNERWQAGKFYHKLQRTGKMRQSFIHKEGKDYVLVTNTAPYFKYHQSRLPRKKIPRRIMMKLDERRKQYIVKLFHQELIKKANESI